MVGSEPHTCPGLFLPCFLLVGGRVGLVWHAGVGYISRGELKEVRNQTPSVCSEGDTYRL